MPEKVNGIATFHLSAWTFAKEMISVFFFRGKEEALIKGEGIAFKIPYDLIEDTERKIEDLGLNLILR